jgi:competence protein ComEC
VFYAGLVATILWGRRHVPARWQIAVLAAWVTIGFAAPLARSLTRDQLDCSFIAVGHGTCILLQAPGGETLLYDAGSLSSPEYTARTIASCLWDRGIMRIDGIVLSHTDVDHYNAVPELLKRFRVGAVYVSPLMFEDLGGQRPAVPRIGPSSAGNLQAESAPDVLRAAIDRAGVPIRVVWAGDRLRLGPQVTLDVLHPPRRGVIGSDNANSVTLAVEYAGRRMLLPGDLESPGLEEVIAERPLLCDIILAPHHGSRLSDPPGFAAWTTPKWVVVSGGRADVEPVVAAYRQAGAAVLQTHRQGAITFSIRGDRIDAATWKK